MRPILILLSDFALAEWNCYDEANSGCSHFCNQADMRCECPACWTLQDDLITCQPDVDKITTTCSAEGITVAVDQCVYNGDMVDDVVTVGYEDSADCIGTWDDTMLTISSALDTCGASAELSDDKIVFTNQLQVLDRVNSGGIVLMANVNIDITCSFDTSVTVATDNTVEESSSTGGTTGAGELNFVASYYMTDQFNMEVAADFVVTLGESVHLGIKPATENALFSYYVDSCMVMDGADNTYPIIENRITNDVIVISTTGESTAGDGIFGVTYQSFKFLADTDPDEVVVTVSCRVNIIIE